jgi:hypothetical protein
MSTTEELLTDDFLSGVIVPGYTPDGKVDITLLVNDPRALAERLLMAAETKERVFISAGPPGDALLAPGYSYEAEIEVTTK